jgi:NTP pyrophosphatase (non-canonical NTP hydrolase)
MKYENKIYRLAVKKWGYPLQLGMLIEECAELIQATNKVLRYKNSSNEKDCIYNLAEEIADVEIMIGQLKIMFNWYKFKEKIKEHKEEKLTRLKMMLETSENKKLETSKEKRK